MRSELRRKRAFKFCLCACEGDQRTARFPHKLSYMKNALMLILATIAVSVSPYLHTSPPRLVTRAATPMRRLVFIAAARSKADSSEGEGEGLKRTVAKAEGSDGEGEGLKRALGKAAWVGAEAMGKIASAVGSDPATVVSEGLPPASFVEAAAMVRDDYDYDYFLTGRLLNEELYSESCFFCDPFAGFRGRARFVSNLANLALFVDNYKNRLLSFEADEGQSEVVARVLVRMRLKLPWRPIIGWVWRVTHVLEEEKKGIWRVTEHKEEWEIEPWEGVKQVARDGREKQFPS